MIGGLSMIRRAVPSDLPDILEIYAIARRFMAQAGNPDQWRDVYPPEDLVQDDIRQGFCHGLWHRPHLGTP